MNADSISTNKSVVSSPASIKQNKPKYSIFQLIWIIFKVEQ